MIKKLCQFVELPPYCWPAELLNWLNSQALAIFGSRCRVVTKAPTDSPVVRT